jgi:hypothetical protein
MLFGLAMIAALAGCKTLGGSGATIALVSTTPPGARVNVEGFGECESPCTVEIDRPREITVAKAGYNPQRLTLEPGKKRVDIVLELSAPTTGVDETALPDL